MKENGKHYKEPLFKVKKGGVGKDIFRKGNQGRTGREGDGRGNIGAEIWIMSREWGEGQCWEDLREGSPREKAQQEDRYWRRFLSHSSICALSNWGLR